LDQQTFSLLWIIGLFALLYFMLIRPQQVRQKKHLQMLRALKVDDRVVTAGGIYGSIVKIKDDTVILRVAENVKIEVLKHAISQVTKQAKGEEKV
jgi:preprotein translocase subunit YajC